MTFHTDYAIHAHFRCICIPLLGGLLRACFYPWEAK
jgi:hypothetical protein